MRMLIALALAFALSGCLAQAAVDVVTLPVKAAGAAVGAVAPSQKKRDERRGRALRKYDECRGKEQHKADKEHREPDFGRCGEVP
jgi:uncharacterized lipoprotein YajG